MATEYKLPYTASEINNKLGQIDSLAQKSEIPTKTSDLTNDSGFITGYTETDPTVPSWAKASTKPSYTKSEVGLGNVDNVKQYSASNPPPYPVTKVNNKTGAVTLSASDVGADASGTAKTAVSTHDVDTIAHADIRAQISQLSSEKVDKSELEVIKDEIRLAVIDSFGGNPVFGYVDAANNIILSGNIAGGSYTIKYEMNDGSLVNVGDLTIDNTGNDDTDSTKGNLADPTSADWLTDYRLSASTGEPKEHSGHIVTNFIPVKQGDVLRVKGLNISSIVNSKECVIVAYKSDKTFEHAVYTGQTNTASDFYGQTQVVVDGAISTYTILMTDTGNNKATANTAFIRIDGALLGDYTANDVIITINEEIPNTYTNQITKSINADGTPFVGTNGEKGYKTGYRLSLSGGGESAQEGTEVTGFIPITNTSIIRVKNIPYEGDTIRGVVGYDENFNKVTTGNGVNLDLLFNNGWASEENDGVRAIAVSAYTHFSTTDLKYIRLCSTDINENSIITINEKIV